LLPPLAGEGRDGGRAAGARWMATSCPAPAPALPRTRGGSNSACDLLPLLPPLAGEGRDGGRAAGARWMTRASALCPAPTPALPRTRGREQERIHENHPCSIQWPCSPGGAKAQARWPCEVSMT